MKLVYIAHPLSGDWEANIADARLWVRAALEAGYAPIAPYLMTEGVLHEPEDRELGLALDCAIVARCDEVWMCGGRTSPGMWREQDAALLAGVKVRSFYSREQVAHDLDDEAVTIAQLAAVHMLGRLR